MRAFELSGRVTRFISSHLSRLGFKNVKDTSITTNNRFNLCMKDGTEATILILNRGENVVIWSVRDFQTKAQSNKGDNWNVYYNENKFQEALNVMMNKHDPMYGITWDTIDFYLDEMCKK